MVAEEEIELERLIHDLLAGELDDWDRADILWRIASDHAARDKLAESIRLQRRVRKAMGDELDREFVQRSLARTMAAVREQPAASVDQPASTRTLRIRRVGLAAAAVLLVGCVGVLAGRWTAGGSLPETVAQVPPAGNGVLAPLRADDLLLLQQTWQQVAESGAKSWVVLAGGKGEFGYLPAGGPNGAQPMLVRCAIVSDNGTISQLHMLVPPQRVKFRVPGVAQLAGEPVDLAVQSETGQSVRVGLQIGDGAASEAGLQATVATGQKATEVGRFRLDNRVFRVYLEAQPLATGAGVS